MAGVTAVPKAILFVTIASMGLCVCFLSVFRFAVFLFRNGFVVIDHSDQSDCKPNADAANPYWSDLFIDLLLIAVFILQHSLMACRLWKDFIQWLGLDAVERSLYILATCAALQVLMSYWRPLLSDSSVLWSLDTNNQTVWISFSIIYFLGWLCVVGVVMVLDYAELVGIKQVYYYVMGQEPPIQMKSREYQRLFQNFRHPVLTGLLTILWAIPVMTVSRLVLALSLSVYTVYGHGLDMQDHSYICLQRRLKKVALGSTQGCRGGRSVSVSYG